MPRWPFHLTALADQLSGFSSNLGNQAEVGRAALQLASDPLLREAHQPGKLDPDRAQAALDKLGLSMEELQAVAKRLGIDIDDGGKLVGGALVQLAEAVGVTIDKMTHFGTSLSDREQRLATRDALGLGPNVGLPPDVQALARTREIQLGGLELDPALEARIAALDLTTEEGRQAFLEFNRMLFRMAENGELTAEQLGTFASVDELLGPIHDAATGINALGESALDAANELSIRPDSAKLGPVRPASCLPLIIN